MGDDTYSMSFTTGGLCHRESVSTAALFLKLGDWKAVRERVFADNLFQCRTVSTLTRVFREVVSRLMTCTREELEYLVGASPREQGYLLWLAVCRRYGFIARFAAEVLRERYITLKNDLDHAEYEAFFNRQAETHPELDEISPTTRSKLRQVLFKMLREAELLTRNGVIQPAMFSQEMVELLWGRREEFLFFPVFEADLRRMKR